MRHDEDDTRVAAIEAPVVRHAQFGPPLLSDTACPECYDTGRSGGSAWTAGERCEVCRGLGSGTRLLRAIGLGGILAARPRHVSSK